jgi:protein-S-isoprenylcysteine O-methyltransferase Ste14
MELLADLEIGWLNGWIYSAIFLVISSSAYIFANRMTSFSWMTKKQVLLAGIADVATVGLCIFTIWKPIAYPGVLFWVGNVIYILGLVITIMSIVAFAKTPDDKPVTRGIYQVFCHPYYLGGYLSLIGIGLICREWLIILGTIVSMIPGFCSAKWEEEHLEETYGHEYIEYKKSGYVSAARESDGD